MFVGIQVILPPLAMIFVALNPVSLPIALILAEALSTANVLATTEALVRGVPDDESSSSSSSSDISSRQSGALTPHFTAHIISFYIRQWALVDLFCFVACDFRGWRDKGCP